MPTSTTSFGRIDPSHLPAWPRVTEYADRIEIAGWHRSFASRLRLHQGTKFFARVFIVYTALAMLTYAVGLTRDEPVRRRVLYLAAAHAHVLWNMVRHVYPGQPPAMLVLYFFVPLIVGTALRASLPAVDVLMTPLSLRKSRAIVTETSITVGGKEYARGHALTIEFRASPYARLAHLKQDIEKRRNQRARRIQTIQRSSAGTGKQGTAEQRERTEQAMVARHERLENEEERQIRWYDEMRTVEMVCGGRLVKIASFTSPEKAADFVAACEAALAALV